MKVFMDNRECTYANPVTKIIDGVPFVQEAEKMPWKMAKEIAIDETELTPELQTRIVSRYDDWVELPFIQ